MQSASVIVLAKVLDYKLVAGPREVEEPAQGPNPATMIPLHLAQISANAVLALRGTVRGRMRFYSWVWASGQHGGKRLFRPYPGYCHVLFLREESGYLHTVADYPAYDLALPCNRLSSIISGWQSGSGEESDLFERLVDVLLKTHLESADAIYENYEPPAMEDLVGLASDFFCRKSARLILSRLSKPVRAIRRLYGNGKSLQRAMRGLPCC